MSTVSEDIANVSVWGNDENVGRHLVNRLFSNVNELLEHLQHTLVLTLEDALRIVEIWHEHLGIRVYYHFTGFRISIMFGVKSIKKTQEVNIIIRMKSNVYHCSVVDLDGNELINESHTVRYCALGQAISILSQLFDGFIVRAVVREY